MAEYLQRGGWETEKPTATACTLKFLIWKELQDVQKALNDPRCSDPKRACEAHALSRLHPSKPCPFGRDKNWQRSFTMELCEIIYHYPMTEILLASHWPHFNQAHLQNEMKLHAMLPSTRFFAAKDSGLVTCQTQAVWQSRRLRSCHQIQSFYTLPRCHVSLQNTYHRLLWSMFIWKRLHPGSQSNERIRISSGISLALDQIVRLLSKNMLQWCFYIYIYIQKKITWHCLSYFYVMLQ